MDNFSIPSLKAPQPSQAKIDKLVEDLEKLSMQSAMESKQTGGVPSFQRQGYLEKLGHSRQKWFKRFFVLRDSFMLSYNLQKSDYTTEPRSAIHMGGSVVCKSESTNEREFCFDVVTDTGDQFKFCASSSAERRSWIDDLLIAKEITHASMVKLAVENQCLAEEKGMASVAREASTSALATFSNLQYVQDTPLTGGIEGWLSTTGFNFTGGSSGSLLKKSPWKRCYFMLRDSHLLMFNSGDILTKPRGVMYLVGTHVEVVNAQENSFRVKSVECGDQIDLMSSGEKGLRRWKRALAVGARVTYPDYKLLEDERVVLAEVVLTPRAPTPRGPAANEMRDAPSVLEDNYDLLGQELGPGEVQAYDEYGSPLIRHPGGDGNENMKGQLINSNTGEVVPPTMERFSAMGEPLDAFNRPLPPGAVSMYDANNMPIGVGPDGLHYTPDGEVVDKFATHYDAAGTELTQDIINAADLVAPTISVAMKVKSALRTDAAPMAMDPLGREFQSMEADSLVTADGFAVPSTARRVEMEGKLVTYEEAQAKGAEVAAPAAAEPENSTLIVMMESEEGESQLGFLEVDAKSTLFMVRGTIKNDMQIEDFVFLHEGVPLTKMEEKTKLAHKFSPEITVRGRELKTTEEVKPMAEKTFTKKVAMIEQEKNKVEEEQAEFFNVLNKVKEGKFLKSVGRDLTK